MYDDHLTYMCGREMGKCGVVIPSHSHEVILIPIPMKLAHRFPFPWESHVLRFQFDRACSQREANADFDVSNDTGRACATQTLIVYMLNVRLRDLNTVEG